MATRLAAILALVCLASNPNFSFAQTLWNAGIGDWSASGNWTLGAPGAITDAQINNGGTAQILASGAQAFNVTLGATPLSSGAIAVQGGQAQFTSVVAVGAFGAGALNITQGGSLSNIHGRIGRELGGTGVVTVSDAGSLWHNDGDLTVGSAAGGVGTLTIENQATVHVQNDLNISNTGVVNLNGGTLRFNTVAGLNRLNYAAGTIQLAGDRTIRSLIGVPSALDLYGTAPVVPSGKGLAIEGNTTVLSDLLVTGGTFTSQGTLLVGSLGAFSGGNLRVVNGGAAATGGDMDIEIGSLDTGVSGAGSTLSVGGSLTLKSFVIGNKFRIDSQGSAYITNSLNVQAGSTVFLNGGTLRFDGYSNAGTVSYTAGAIQLAGDRVIGSDAATVEFFGTTPVIGSGKALAVEQTATIASGLTINGGTFRANSVVVNGPLDFDHGVLELTGGTITGLSSLAVPTNGEFRSRGAPGLRIVGAAGSTITATGDLTLGNTSAVNGFGTQGTLQVGAHAVTLLDANDVVFDSLSLVTLGGGGVSGVIDAANGLTLDFGGNITGFGAVDTPNDIAKPLRNNGHITGNSLTEPITLSGYVKGVGTFDNVNFTGSFAPGFSPAQLLLGSASYHGVLEIEIGGTLPGSGYDQLNHILGAGIAQLGGTLQASVIGGFTPELGDSFEFLMAMGGVSGKFVNEILPTLSSGLGWNVNYGANSVVLEVVASAYQEADFDEDGDVDGNDLMRWRNNFGTGTTHMQGDANGDADADGGDFLIWQRQFGGPGFAASANVPVPEPAAPLLFIFAMLGIRQRGGQLRQEPR